MKDTPSMPPVSIVIPLRIESTEREANLHCVLQYLLRSPFVYIDLLEADKERRFFFSHHERIRYRFVHDEAPVFYRTRYLNGLLRDALHSIVGIWDADVLIPEAQLIAGVWHILGGCVLCFPYNGTFRFLEKERSNAIRKNVDELQAGEGCCLLGRPSVGGAFLVVAVTNSPKHDFSRCKSVIYKFLSRDTKSARDKNGTKPRKNKVKNTSSEISLVEYLCFVCKGTNLSLEKRGEIPISLIHNSFSYHCTPNVVIASDFALKQHDLRKSGVKYCFSL
ncbi:hypothetical protein [uncultured Phocaeicola sp.]|uniref:hypothetical protein n=1 Tax=uncultured Phocaeicola sp. TaxID=990718 RepID=UPI0025AE1309|nr:hypothetical protein [uncultured Phocaeicola sp.]